MDISTLYKLVRLHAASPLSSVAYTGGRTGSVEDGRYHQRSEIGIVEDQPKEEECILNPQAQVSPQKGNMVEHIGWDTRGVGMDVMRRRLSKWWTRT